MSFNEKMKNLSHGRKKQDFFSDFILNMDQLFSGKPLGGVLQTMDGFFQTSSKNRSFPLELGEEQDVYIVKAQLPGVNKKQIKIQALDQALIITVENRELINEKDQNGNLLRNSHTLQNISRSVNFLKPINEQRIHAEHKDGLLIITVPKIKGKEIKILN